jgi:seryl-tRNA synthetase
MFAEEEAAKARNEAESYRAQLADQHRSLQTQLNSAKEEAAKAKKEAESYKAQLANIRERENPNGRILCVNRYCTRRFREEEEREHHMTVCTLR